MSEKKEVNYNALKKGGFMRQKQKGYFSLRLSVVGGHLTTENLRAVSDVADKYGKGYVHLTARQGVEIPFIYIDDIDDVKADLAKGGVAPGVCGPRVRTVTACQGNQVCPSGCIDSQDIAKELSQRYFGHELPHKFKFGVTGCCNNCLKAEENDVGIKGGMITRHNNDNCIACGVCVKACRSGALTLTDEGKIIKNNRLCNNCGRCVKACPSEAWTGTSGYMVYFAGQFGNHVNQGKSVVPIIKDKETLFRVTDAAIKYFGEHANPSERFRQTLERLGTEEFDKVIKEAYRG